MHDLLWVNDGGDEGNLMKAESFDYIVIGGGSAGCVVANRLSADPQCRVALIEAGASDRTGALGLKTSLPIGNIFVIPDARYNWNYSFEGSEGVRGRSIPCPRGKLLGGCSSINGSVYMRGHPNDYDEWASLGNDGWRYSDVLPFFKRHEDWREPINPESHGTGGELRTVRIPSTNLLSHAFVEAAEQAGFPSNADFNASGGQGNQAVQDGFGLLTVTQRDGVRMSSSRAFVHPIMNRSNLTVFTGAIVERIDLDGRRAVGVTVCHGGERKSLKASTEIVLSAGAINSPQILMLSGIGPRALLEELGIPVAHELPGVGENLQDHPTVIVKVEDPSRTSYAMSWAKAPRIAYEAVRYAVKRKGMFASNGGEVGGFVRTLPSLDRPDIQFSCFVGMKDNVNMPRRHGYMMAINICRPKSRGTVRLRSADPSVAPVLSPNFLQDKADVDTLVRGIRVARNIISQPALSRFSGAELAPGREVVSDDALAEFVRSTVSTVYHPVGTCKMGPKADPLAVVDARLRVHGIAGLRVADTSIMPTIVGANTSAPAMMIGERVAAFILEDRAAVKIAA